MRKFLTLLAIITAFSNIGATHDPSRPAISRIQLEEFRTIALKNTYVCGTLGTLCLIPTVWASKKIKALNQSSDDIKNTPDFKKKIRRLKIVKGMCAFVSGFCLSTAGMNAYTWYSLDPNSVVGKFLLNEYSEEEVEEINRTNTIKQGFENQALRPQALADLGLPKTATKEEISKKFRQLSLTCHPDKMINATSIEKDAAAKKFNTIQKAHDILIK